MQVIENIQYYLLIFSLFSLTRACSLAIQIFLSSPYVLYILLNSKKSQLLSNKESNNKQEKKFMRSEDATRLAKARTPLFLVESQSIIRGKKLFLISHYFGRLRRGGGVREWFSSDYLPFPVQDTDRGENCSTWKIISE